MGRSRGGWLARKPTRLAGPVSRRDGDERQLSPFDVHAWFHHPRMGVALDGSDGTSLRKREHSPSFDEQTKFYSQVSCELHSSIITHHTP